MIYMIGASTPALNISANGMTYLTGMKYKSNVVHDAKHEEQLNGLKCKFHL